MTSEPQHPKNLPIRASNSVCNNRQEITSSFSDNQADERPKEVEQASTLGTESNINECCSSLKPTWSCLEKPSRQSADDSDNNSVDALFDGTCWRVTIASVSDVPERKASSDSIDSEVLSSTLDAAPGLDDVFEDLFKSVLDEMDTFGPGAGGTLSSWPSHVAVSTPSETPIPFTGPFTTQPYRPNDLIPGYSFNPFGGLNIGLAQGLQNPSRGLITAMRRLCDLLSKPRSDHLDSVFVRLLNNALKEMEEAAQPAPHKRPRKKAENGAGPKRRRVKPSKSAPDYETVSKFTLAMGPKRSQVFRSQPQLSTVSSGFDTAAGTETVDLTEDSEEERCKRKQDNHLTEKERYLDLGDTVTHFMGNLFFNY